MGQVVTLTELGDGIVQVTMHDKASRNMFSKELIASLMETFGFIARQPSYKVVILTGYDNYFCCGGTKEELMGIYKGDLAFDHINFFTLPLDCEIPVISAMQGHAIGGGLVFGLYADFIVLGRENIYTANFMKYGFTPGMGGTLLVPMKVGAVLGYEMLFSAENYRGGELKERGTPLRVVPKSEVLRDAIELAKQLAEKPRLSLITLKQHLADSLRQQLPKVIQEELAMHDKTFHQREVAQKIEALFGQ